MTDNIPTPDALVTLGVSTKGADDRAQTFQELSELAANLSVTHDYVNVSATMVDDVEDDEPEQLYADGNTIQKVLDAIMDLGYSARSASDIVSRIQNAGILFRERVA